VIARDTVREVTLHVSTELARWSNDGGVHAASGEAVEMARRLVDEWLSRQAREAVRRGESGMSAVDEEGTAVAVLDNIFGLGELQPYVDDPAVESIFVNGHDNVFVRRSGEPVVAVPAIADSDEELEGLVRRLAAREGLSERRFDDSAPFLSLTLRDGSRLHAAMGVCPRPTLTIRRHRLLDATLRDLVRMRMLTEELRGLLEAAILAQCNVVIAGGPSAGKSSLLRTLASAIPREMRIVTIEDTYELFLDRDHDRHPNCVALEARPANVQGEGAITLADLVYQALRMGPDVLAVGEVRGPEVVPMLDALSAGNAAGSMCTVHARSTLGTFDRLKGLLAQAPERYGAEASASLISTAVDLVVHIASTTLADEALHRWVDSVQEVRHAEGPTVVSNEVLRVDAEGRMHMPASLSSDLKERLFGIGYDVGEWRNFA
jgi:Flp pilus assembly CpaF family ATPase